MNKQKLSAPGTLAQWIDASEIALDTGDFTKIKLNRQGDVMTAEYGADTISIRFAKKDQGHVLLRIECDDEQVLEWYKSCVADVIKNPEKFEDYYAEEEEFDPIGQNPPSPGPAAAVPPTDDALGEDGGSPKGKLKRLLVKKWAMVVLIIALPPLGLYVFYRYHRSGFGRRVVITLVTILYTLFIWLGFFGINTGFGLSTITTWFGEITHTTQQKIDNVTATPAPTPTVEVNPEE
ncbi:MAG: hypothetical protein VB030_06510 [Eubacterium aggregans]|uniref:Uncharacterized protein n=1 Tax=Eubacterium aggregans TaxID=81409 RepID=A0A1H4C7T4_9FIRM|nr:hypothetical protein [Eubacterium aggregans]MDD4691484.1 hypothetical protein [Eubacterium aggregans]MEA5073807.1 hypothetical protein [Eubacterium aggregans]SEA56406.1 hypothetical protein SAMN04515656_11426 [Eubacterium aggregans]